MHTILSSVINLQKDDHKECLAILLPREWGNHLELSHGTLLEIGTEDGKLIIEKHTQSPQMSKMALIAKIRDQMKNNINDINFNMLSLQSLLGETQKLHLSKKNEIKIETYNEIIKYIDSLNEDV